MKSTLVGSIAGLSAALATAYFSRQPPGPQPVREVPVYVAASPRDLAARFLPTTRAADVSTKLDRVLPTIAVERMPLSKVIDLLAKATGAQFYVEWEPMMGDSAIGPDTPITLAEHDISAADALRLALKQAKANGPDARFRVVDGVVKISTRLDRWPQIRVYDVRDLIESSATMSRNLPSPPADRPERDAEDALRKLILTSIDLEEWRGVPDPERAINFFAGRMVVNQTADNHDTIAALLAALRAKQQQR